MLSVQSILKMNFIELLSKSRFIHRKKHLVIQGEVVVVREMKDYNKFRHNAHCECDCVEVLAFNSIKIKLCRKLFIEYFFLERKLCLDRLPRIVIFLICCMISRRIVLLIRIIEILLGIRLSIAGIRFSNSAFDNTIVIIIIAAIIVLHPAAVATAHL